MGVTDDIEDVEIKEERKQLSEKICNLKIGKPGVGTCTKGSVRGNRQAFH